MAIHNPATKTFWGVLWRSKNKLDGVTKHLMWEKGAVKQFHTREDARHWIKQHYGYFADRPDLKTEPHGWRMPIPVKVEATYTWQDEVNGEPPKET